MAKMTRNPHFMKVLKEHQERTDATISKHYGKESNYGRNARKNGMNISFEHRINKYLLSNEPFR